MDATGRSSIVSAALALALVLSGAPAGAAEAFVVEAREIAELKSIFGEVRSRKVVPARARIGGTVTRLDVAEGDHVEAGQALAVVVDEKLALRIEAVDAQILAAEAEAANARLELERGRDLRERGIIAQARLDQLQTIADVAAQRLEGLRAERSVITQQIAEGTVVAPSEGRVLAVPVTEGAVVGAGETVATVAADDYILRLEVPERHARTLAIGDPVTVGPRGLESGEAAAMGRIVQVYPELSDGRVVADAEVPGLGDYFVGERALVWIEAGARAAVVVPRALVSTRFGIDFVRLAREGAPPLDVVVQLGQPTGVDEIEVLAGLRPGDRVVAP